MATLGKRVRDLDLPAILDELPAAQFLWYNNVPLRKKTEFKKILVRLMKLFVTPHVTNVYPYLSCSYLKKYETLHSNEKSSISNIISLLSLENDVIEGHLLDQIILLKSASGTNTLYNDDLKTHVTSWYNNVTSKPILCLHLNVVHLAVGFGHSTFIVLKKCEGVIKFFYFNPHGYNELDTEKSTIFRNVSSYLPVPVREIVAICPRFQVTKQGNNCKQWALLLFVLLMSNPNWFDNPSELLNNLAKHATLNIMVFSLAMFLRLMHLYGLKRYYYIFLIVMLKVPKIPNFLQECNIEDKIYRDFWAQTIGVPNCNDLKVEVCPLKCASCNNRCSYKVSVQTTEGEPCKLLNPKEIAYKMFDLYFELQKLSGHTDTLSFNKSMRGQPEAQLELPSSVEDYLTLQILPPENFEQFEELKISRQVNVQKPRLLQELEQQMQKLLLKGKDVMDDELFIRTSTEFRTWLSKLELQEGTGFLSLYDYAKKRVEYLEQRVEFHLNEQSTI